MDQAAYLVWECAFLLWLGAASVAAVLVAQWWMNRGQR